MSKSGARAGPLSGTPVPPDPGRSPEASSDAGEAFRTAAKNLAEADVRALIDDDVISPADRRWFVERACAGLPALAYQRWLVGDSRVLEEILGRRVRNLAEFKYLRNVQYSTLWTKLLNRARGIVNNPELAKDVVQATFVRATQSGDGYRGDASYETWLGTILWHVICTETRSGNGTLIPSASLSGLRDEGPPPACLDPLVEFLYGPEQSPEKRTWEREIVGKVFERIRVLLTDSYSYRAIFLTFVEGKSAKETARLLGVTVSHYYKILATARKRLRNSPSVRALLELEGIHARPSKNKPASGRQ